MSAPLNLHAQNRKEVFTEIEKYLADLKFDIISRDFERPWGGFFVINERQAKAFAEKFFPGVAIDDLKISGKLSPKILVVQPESRLSWQYHFRRAEIWRVVSGKVGVTLSDTDEEVRMIELDPGETIRLAQGERHRLRGLRNWGVVAEIWQHTDIHHPSDEQDIVRVQDDFGR